MSARNGNRPSGLCHLIRAPCLLVRQLIKHELPRYSLDFLWDSAVGHLWPFLLCRYLEGHVVCTECYALGQPNFYYQRTKRYAQLASQQCNISDHHCNCRFFDPHAHYEFAGVRISQRLADANHYLLSSGNWTRRHQRPAGDQSTGCSRPPNYIVHGHPDLHHFWSDCDPELDRCKCDFADDHNGLRPHSCYKCSGLRFSDRHSGPEHYLLRRGYGGRRIERAIYCSGAGWSSGAAADHAIHCQSDFGQRGPDNYPDVGHHKRDHGYVQPSYSPGRRPGAATAFRIRSCPDQPDNYVHTHCHRSRRELQPGNRDGHGPTYIEFQCVAQQHHSRPERDTELADRRWFTEFLHRC